MVEKKNIFLDFMSPDNWKTYITMNKFSRDMISIICKSINLSEFITKDYCIIPPAFLLQSSINRKAISNVFLYVEERFLVFPLKEHNLDIYFNKKENEYISVKGSHKGFYDNFGKRLIEKSKNAIIPRNASMGKSIADSWQNISDNSDIWVPINMSIPILADSIREAPSILKRKGLSVTLEAIKKEVNIIDRNNDFIINQAIQHDYLSTYLYEYDCEIISNIPPKPLHVDYLVGSKKRFYDYLLLRKIFNKLGILSLIENANPETIIRIRQTLEYRTFYDILFELCGHHDQEFIMDHISFVHAQIKNYPKRKSFFESEYTLLSNILYSVVENYNHITPFRRPFMLNKRKVFIVHGHDNEAKQETARFLERLDLEAVILHEQPSKGRTIIEKLDEYTDVDYAIVLYTPCDEGRSARDTTYSKRARQNVVFEHGYLVSKLGRDKVCALIKEDTEQPGDLAGVLYIKMDVAGAWKMKIVNEMNAIGYNIDLNKLL